MTRQMVPRLTKPGQLLKGKHHKDGEYFEPEVKAEVLPEEEEEGVGRFVTEPEDIRRTEVIRLEEEVKDRRTHKNRRGRKVLKK